MTDQLVIREVKSLLHLLKVNKYAEADTRLEEFQTKMPKKWDGILHPDVVNIWIRTRIAVNSNDQSSYIEHIEEELGFLKALGIGTN